MADQYRKGGHAIDCVSRIFLFGYLTRRKNVGRSQKLRKVLLTDVGICVSDIQRCALHQDSLLTTRGERLSPLAI